MSAFDYIVVGGGSSGCIVAAQLASQDARARVLLLESGPAAEDHPETLDADGYKDAFINDHVMWERFSAPQPHCGNQRVFMGSGTVLGGSGSINGMVYLRGARHDFEEWPAGWRWDDVAGDFEALELRLRPHQRSATRWTEACISAAQECGFSRSENFNDGDLSDRIGYEWMSYEAQNRRSSYVAFIKDAARQTNLQVQSLARVQRILFDEHKRACAVEYQQGVRGFTARASREIIVCAGALETPKLLMLSGVGPGQALRTVGIPVVADRPGVGQNLQDHPNVPLFFRGAEPVDCNYPQLYSFFRTNPDTDLPAGQSDTCYVFWPARSAMKQAAKRMLPGKVLPESLYNSRLKGALRSAVELAFASKQVRDFVERMFGVVVILGKPKSRGSMRLRSNKVEEDAIIDPAYYSDPQDMETMVRGVKLARRISESGTLATWNRGALLPSARIKKDDAIARWVGKNTITTYHYGGTCSMGSDSSAVTDTRLRVRGVTGLRVADASVIPSVPVSALNAPSMLVGYRAARFIGEDHRA